MAGITIRKDFESISDHLNIFLEYYKTFKEFNIVDWSHLKNREDFEKIYFLDDTTQRLYKQLYSDGRDIAIYFQSQLQEFNYPDTYINISSYVKSFEHTWLDSIHECENFIQKIKEQIAKEENPLWSVRQMVPIYEQEIELMKEIKKILERIKQSKLYRLDNPTKLDKIQLKFKEHPMKTSIIAVSLVLGITVAFSINAEISPTTTINSTASSNQSPIINGNNNAITYSSSTKQSPKDILKNAPLTEKPSYMLDDLQNSVCSVEEGSQVIVLNQTTINQVSFVQVKVLSGTCQNKIGWTMKGNLIHID